MTKIKRFHPSITERSLAYWGFDVVIAAEQDQTIVDAAADQQFEIAQAAVDIRALSLSEVQAKLDIAMHEVADIVDAWHLQLFNSVAEDFDALVNGIGEKGS